MRSKVIIGIASLALLALGCAGAFWFWQGGDVPLPLLGQPPATAEAPSPATVPSASPQSATSPSSDTAASTSPHAVAPTAPGTAAPTSEPQTTAAASPQRAPLPPSEGEATGSAPADLRAATPSFDIVRTEPGGEGVIAGRAAPGWTVKVVSDGAEVAEAKADSQGEWTVVLDKPLPSGQHTLSLQATPPEGGQAVASRQSVPVAVTAAPRPSLQVATPRGHPQGAQQTASVEQTGDAGASLLDEQRKPGTYTIQRGDTLWAIAERYLGAGARYVSIFRTNRGAIKNPNLIHPEQQVKVPEPEE